jgi:uncharacterized protein YciI
MKRLFTIAVTLLFVAAAAHAAEEQKKSYFVYFLKLVRKDTMKTGFTDSEKGVMGEHAAYHARLTKEGTEVLAGPTVDDDPVGICVFSAASIDEAKSIAGNDPAVAKGLMTVTVYPFQFAFGTAAPPRTK